MPTPRLASFLMSFLALSPSAIGLEEPTNETIEQAQKASVATPAPKKPYQRRVKMPTARRMRWRRFRHEMGLKAKGLGSGKGKEKEKEKWIALEDMEGAR